MTIYNHVCYLSFEIHSSLPDGEDITPEALIEAVLARIETIRKTGIQEMIEACLPPDDSFEEEVWVFEFRPQAWIKGQAVEIDQEEGQDYLIRVTPTQACWLVKNFYDDPEEMISQERDLLIDAPWAPKWMREHRGPYEINFLHKEGNEG